MNAYKLMGRLIGVAFAAHLALGAAKAQTIPTRPPNPAPPNMAAETSALRAEIKADVATARAQQKSVAATRQQIQAIRAALRAKLAALHH
ncbi:MAG TPA: hypothetical protein VMU17_07855 [Elusimicrobiota bacterium]|nr:hypothetical protein [Elusimicrobiota bacterium]